MHRARQIIPRGRLARISVLVAAAAPLLALATPASAAAQPSITTTASAGVVIGQSVSDTAVLTGGTKPTGTITFNLYGPNNSTCSGSPALSSSVKVNGNGTYHSGNLKPKTAGTYEWVATYSGDSKNSSVSEPCGSTNESVTVTAATPKMTTTASPDTTVGNSISDAATLSSGVAPTGTITFNAYGPDDPACLDAPAFTSTATVSGNGTYHSDKFSVGEVGTFLFVASYSGDTNNVATSGKCGDANEKVTVSRVSAALALATSKSSVKYGNEHSAKISASVASSSSSSAPTGTVQVTDQNGDPVCTITLVNATGKCAPKKKELKVGDYALTGKYSGNNQVGPATSTAESLTVKKATTKTKLKLSPKTVADGNEHSVHFKVHVKSKSLHSKPKGKIAVRIGKHTICTKKLKHGKATCRVPSSAAPPGTYSVYAAYQGKPNIDGSHSKVKHLHVT